MNVRHVYVGACIVQKRAWDSLELELQEVVSHLELNPGPLREQTAFLTAEPTLHPNVYFSHFSSLESGTVYFIGIMK